MKNTLSKVALSAMLVGSSFAPLTVTNEVSAASVQSLPKQEAKEVWVEGPHVDELGREYPNIKDYNVGFQTKSAEKGTLILEVRRNQFCAGCWENYRITNSNIIADYSKVPVGVNGNKARTATSASLTDLINTNSKEDYYVRLVGHINTITANQTYYLNMMGADDPDSYNFKAYFYPNIDLTKMSKSDRNQYVVNGKDTLELIPKSNVTHIGRVLIKGTNQVLYNPQGKVHRILRQNEGLRVYEVQNDRYQVGGGYYVMKSKDTLYYYGHIYSNEKGYKYMAIYNPSNELFKNFEPMQTSRVYGITERGLYNVGGGYYVIPASHISLER
ncbi:hypothetical protein [Bacillus sp. AFS040349]|uniref:hypothetical protein n=1 Tax=Bacillus sp. AFS040349 TaxID=2033502 RepID=UPI000BFBD701|nr:hypothetical protein [Bacillus sp. AFS040349]PGT83235.1 hypothetical protein COD11_12940 [Bacillus sp. AFS040349]